MRAPPRNDGLMCPPPVSCSGVKSVPPPPKKKGKDDRVHRGKGARKSHVCASGVACLPCAGGGARTPRENKQKVKKDVNNLSKESETSPQTPVVSAQVGGGSPEKKRPTLLHIRRSFHPHRGPSVLPLDRSTLAAPMLSDGKDESPPNHPVVRSNITL